MRDLFSDDGIHFKFLKLLEEPDPGLRMYVYRLVGGEKVKPALYNGEPFEEVFNWLQNVHGGGKFAIFIRRGETMVLACSAGVMRRLDWRKPH